MQIQLLGAPAIVVNGRRLQHPSKKAMALLAYLAMRAGEHISRSHLAALLWADSDEEQARANLRQTLSQLRKLFKDAGHDPVMVPFDKVVLEVDGLEIDVKALLGRLNTLDVAEIAGVPQFLEGLDVQAPEFESWMAAQRGAIRARLATQIEKRAEARHAAGDNGGAAEALALALSFDPLKETLHRALIAALAAQGRSDEALKQYETCRAVLQRELQIEPASETQALAHRIRSARRARSEAAKPATADRQSPAVLASAAADQQPVSRRFSIALDALQQALTMRREAGDNAGLRIAVTAGADDRDAAAMLPLVAAGTVAVSPRVFEQFRERSPFMFGERLVLADGSAAYQLVSEISHHRLLVQPTVTEPVITAVPEFSVAVLPLSNRSPDPDPYGLGSIIAEEVTHRLSRYRVLTVAAPSAGHAFRSLAHAPEQARNLLGANYLVDGSYLRDGDQLRIHISLTDLRINQLVFSHKFDGRFPGAAFDQDELADHVATIIFHKAEGAEIKRAERALTRDGTALEWYLRGLAAHRRAGIYPDNAKDAFSYFSNALDRAPDFARAIAWRLCAVSWFNQSYLTEPGMQEIQHALTIDEDDAEIHRVAGALRLYSGDTSLAVRHLERAVELNPSDAYLLAKLATYWAFSGETEKGLDVITRAMRLDPFLPSWCVEEHGVILYTMDDFEAAITSLKQLATPLPRALAYLAASQIGDGQAEAARATIMRLRSVAPQVTPTQLLASEFYSDGAEKDRLRDRLAKAGFA